MRRPDVKAPQAVPLGGAPLAVPPGEASLAMNAEANLPAKLYFRIGEVASIVGVEPHVLRYWEREFRSIRPTKSSKGQRVYTRRDVLSLMRVKELLYKQGFTIAGARKRLRSQGDEPPAEEKRPEDSKAERR